MNSSDENSSRNDIIDYLFDNIFLEGEIDILSEIYITESQTFEYETFIGALTDEINFQDMEESLLTMANGLNHEEAKSLWEKLGNMLGSKLKSDDAEQKEERILTDDDIIEKIYNLDLRMTEIIMTSLHQKKDMTIPMALIKIAGHEYGEWIESACKKNEFAHMMSERLWMQLLTCRINDRIQVCEHVELLDQLAVYLDEWNFTEFRTLIVALEVDFEIGDKKLKSVYMDKRLRVKMADFVEKRLRPVEIEREPSVKRSCPLLRDCLKFFRLGRANDTPVSVPGSGLGYN